MKKWKVLLLAAFLLCSFSFICGCVDDNEETAYGYNKNDPYYSTNDHNHDGKLNGNEFQDAVNDWMDDMEDALN